MKRLEHCLIEIRGVSYYHQILECLFPTNSLCMVSDKLCKTVKIGRRKKESDLHKQCCCMNLAGESESRSVLDAFFLGKALAEALNERIESAVGEFLSTIGRLQAEQQKQVQDFQDDVLERARRAKEKAAREAMEAQGLISKSTTTTDTSAGTDEVTAVVPSPSTTAITLSASSSSPPATYSDLNPNKQ